VWRRISRECAEDHARLFYGKSGTDTADGSICEKAEQAWVCWARIGAGVFSRGKRRTVQRAIRRRKETRTRKKPASTKRA